MNGEASMGFGPRVRGWVKGVRGGDLGALPVLVGLLAMALVFQVLAPQFLSPKNLGNLAVQIVPTGLISLGIVLVLLLGEVDLSAGSVSGFAAAIVAVLSVAHHLHPVLAMVLGIVVGAVIGALQGWVSAGLGVPSFVVTLAGLIGWQGALLHTLGDTGTINIPYGGTIAVLANTYVEDLALGYAIAVAPAVVYAGLELRERARRMELGLPARAPAQILVRAGALAAIAFAGAWILGRTRGVPLALIVFIGLVMVMDFVLRRTRYGRHVFAVGGNAEAARRAGIRVTAVRVSVFAIASSFAALGGLMQTSRLFAVNQSSGSGDVLLNAIAAAVIGGTSLFGGRGSPWSAPLGMLVIGSIQSGILLLNLKSDAQYMITGAVLLIAVTVDSISRRGRLASGRG